MVKILPKNVIFQFSNFGEQKDICYVIVPEKEDVVEVTTKVKEVAVPQRIVYGTGFGCSFVSSSVDHMFLSYGNLDYVLHGSKYWVMSMGWEKGSSIESITPTLHSHKIFPIYIIQSPSVGDDSMTGFLMKFERMKDVKEVMVRIHGMGGRNGLPAHKFRYAQPVLADIHWHGDQVHADRRKDDDGYLDEPIDY